MPIEYSKGDIAIDVLKERWEECKQQPSELVKEIAKEVGCSLPPVWDAYREIKRGKALEVAKPPEIEAKNGENQG